MINSVIINQRLLFACDSKDLAIQCCVGTVVCAVEEIEKSTLFWGKEGKCEA